MSYDMLADIQRLEDDNRWSLNLAEHSLTVYQALWPTHGGAAASEHSPVNSTHGIKVRGQHLYSHLTVVQNTVILFAANEHGRR